LLRDDPSQSILTAFASVADGAYCFGSLDEAMARCYAGPPLKLDRNALERLISVLVDVKELEQPGGSNKLVLPDAELHSAFPDAHLVVDKATYVDPVQGLSTTCTVLASLIAISWCDSGFGQRLAKGLAANRATFGWQFLTVEGGIKDELKISTEIFCRRTGARRPLFASSSDALEQWPALVEKASVIWFRKLQSEMALKPSDYVQFKRPIDVNQSFGADRLPESVLRALWGTSVDQQDVGSSDVLGTLRRLAADNGGALDRPVIAETTRGRASVSHGLIPSHCYAVLGVIEEEAVVVRDPYGRPSRGTASLQPFEQPLRQRANMRPLNEIARAGVKAVSFDDFKACFRSAYFASKRPPPP
jgi:hypothetical protein